MGRLFRLAERLGVRLAAENARLPGHVACLLDTFDSPALSLCYDSGHAHFWSPDFDWPELMGRIAEAGCCGCIPIEAEMRTAGYADLPDFLRRAAETGRGLETILKEATP